MQSTISRAAAFAMSVWFCAAAVTPTSAQGVRGEVIDKNSQPLSNALITLYDTSDRRSGMMFTDSAGAFDLGVDRPGQYRLTVNRDGYRPVGGGPYQLRAGEAVEMYVVLEQVVPIEGVDVSVEGARPALTDAGFYTRREAGFGHFLTREDIQEIGGNSLNRILRSVPRVRVFRGLSSTDLGSTPGIVISSGYGGGCAPTLYVDGIPVNQGGYERGALNLDRYAQLEDVAAIEVYTGPSTSPSQYSAMAGCGVILLWSVITERSDLRRGGGPGGGPPASESLPR